MFRSSFGICKAKKNCDRQTTISIGTNKIMFLRKPVKKGVSTVDSNIFTSKHVNFCEENPIISIVDKDQLTVGSDSRATSKIFFLQLCPYRISL